MKVVGGGYGWVTRCGFWLVAFAVPACGSEEFAAAPTERELAVWTEVLLIEAALQDFSGPTKDTLAARYYAQLYDRYGLSAEGLDELRERYNEDVDLYEVMSDSVEARLQRGAEDPSRLLNPGLN